MARKDRMPKREKRGKRRALKKPEMKYYLIVTDTEATERHYFEGLRRNLPPDAQEKLCIKVYNVKTDKMLEKCRELAAYEAQHRMLWIVFDRDQVPNFDEIIVTAERSDINVAWSNPCFEIWLFAYFGNMPTLLESQKCCSEFGRMYERETGQKYKKADGFSMAQATSPAAAGLVACHFPLQRPTGDQRRRQTITIGITLVSFVAVRIGRHYEVSRARPDAPPEAACP